MEKFGQLGVVDEYVELCDHCLRFVFCAVVHFLGVLREESSSNRRRMLTKWFEGFLLSF